MTVVLAFKVFASMMIVGIVGSLFSLSRDKLFKALMGLFMTGTMGFVLTFIWGVA